MAVVSVVRPVARSDYSQWLPLWQGYNKFYGRSGETALPDEITQMTWTRFFDVDEPVYALVAENEGQLVGLVHYLFHRSTTSIAPTCYLQDLFTSLSTRGNPLRDRSRLEAFVRAATAVVIGKIQKSSAVEIVKATWPNDHTAELIVRNPVEPAIIPAPASVG